MMSPARKYVMHFEVPIVDPGYGLQDFISNRREDKKRVQYGWKYYDMKISVQ